MKGIKGHIYRPNSIIHAVFQHDEIFHRSVIFSECGFELGVFYIGEYPVNCPKCLSRIPPRPEFGVIPPGHHPWPTLGQEREQEGKPC